jgi:hypothetical protein
MRVFNPAVAVLGLLAGWCGTAHALERGEGLRSIPVRTNMILEGEPVADEVHSCARTVLLR